MSSFFKVLKNLSSMHHSIEINKIVVIVFIAWEEFTVATSISF